MGINRFNKTNDTSYRPTRTKNTEIIIRQTLNQYLARPTDYRKSIISNIQPESSISGFVMSSSDDEISEVTLSDGDLMPQPGRIDVAKETSYDSVSKGKKIYEDFFARLARLAKEGNNNRGIIYYNDPEHIDAFDTLDWINGDWPTIWIGSTYAYSSTLLNVYFI